MPTVVAIITQINGRAEIIPRSPAVVTDLELELGTVVHLSKVVHIGNPEREQVTYAGLDHQFGIQGRGCNPCGLVGTIIDLGVKEGEIISFVGLNGVVGMIENSRVLNDCIAAGRSGMSGIIIRFIPSPPIIVAFETCIFGIIFESSVLNEVSCRLRRILRSKEYILNVLLLGRSSKSPVTNIRIFGIIGRVGPLEIGGCLVGRRQSHILLRESDEVHVMGTGSAGLSGGVGSNRRGRRMNRHHVRSFAVRCTAQELRMNGI